MSVKNRTFSSWNRDHHKTFAAAIAAELEKKANIDSPNFTGIPTAPTPEQGTKTNQIATTEFVADAVGDTSNTQDAVSKSGDTLSGDLMFNIPPNDDSPNGTIYPIRMTGKFKSSSTLDYVWKIGMATIGPIFYIGHNNQNCLGLSTALGLFDATNNSSLSLGYKNRPWQSTYTKKLNNGEDINIPEKAGTMALVSDIEDTLRKYNLIPEEQTTEEQN